MLVPGLAPVASGWVRSSTLFMDQSLKRRILVSEVSRSNLGPRVSQALSLCAHMTGLAIHRRFGLTPVELFDILLAERRLGSQDQGLALRLRLTERHRA